MRIWTIDWIRQKGQKKRLVWTLEKKDTKGNYVDDTDLTEAEIKEVFFQIATGAKTEATQCKSNQSDQQPSWLRLNNWQVWTTLGVLLLIVVGLFFYFWNKKEDSSQTENDNLEEGENPEET